MGEVAQLGEQLLARVDRAHHALVRLGLGERGGEVHVERRRLREARHADRLVQARAREGAAHARRCSAAIGEEGRASVDAELRLARKVSSGSACSVEAFERRRSGGAAAEVVVVRRGRVGAEA